MIRWLIVGVAVASTCMLLFSHMVESCNEAVCGSIVSKCMITGSCKCDLKNSSCSKECFHCLSYLYTECCSCVDMCPKPNHSLHRVSTSSEVADLLDDPIPNLFELLTSEPDRLDRWFSISYPVDFDISLFKPQVEKEFNYQSQGAQEAVTPVKDMLTLNCTVAFMSQCLSLNKCKDTCLSMGAVSYRWFHDGCCECIGDKCMKYGINESRCLRCPPSKIVDPDPDEDDALYGVEDDDEEGGLEV